MSVQRFMVGRTVSNISNNTSIIATGGNITLIGGYRIHTFLSSEVFNVQSNLRVEYLVVAGGGGLS